MPELMNEETRTQIVEILSRMNHPVKLLLFMGRNPSPGCLQQLDVLQAITALSDKLALEVFNAQDHPREAEAYGIDKFPATIPLGEQDHGIRFFGVTGGHESTSLLQAIMMVSAGLSGLAPELESLIRRIVYPVHIQVFVTMACPYCPKMVHTSHQFAFINDNIQADMVEGSQFPDLVQKYQVEGVPKTIINETTSLEGAQPEGVLYMTILRTIDPAEYRRLEAAMRDARGMRHVKPLEEKRIYDTIIVGGGPAALSAALYAARKKLDVGLVAAQIGGQMTYTAQIENYLGFPGVGGNELLERFQFHVESYPISEHLGTQVTLIEKTDQGFTVHTKDGRAFSARTLIYCAGKEYSRLDVPNEEPTR